MPLIIIFIFIIFCSQAHSADFGQVGVMRTSTPNESPVITLEEKLHVLCDKCPSLTKFNPIVVVHSPGIVLKVGKPKNIKEEPVIVEENKVLYFPLGKTNPVGGDDIKKLTSSYVSSIESVAIKGFTCDIGSKAVNDKLAVKRAEVVSKIFLEHGVSREKIKVEGLGKCCYKASPAQSRRVEITIRKKQQTNQGG